ncbi:MAG TPA: hypothetical protein VLV48_08195 [Thermoanaerobaculia bacterium]|nr:hypothetical protein [Thermoanaerobaculia bacterium]
MRTGRILAVFLLWGATLPASDHLRAVRAWETIAQSEALLEALGAMARLADTRSNSAEAAAFVLRDRAGFLSLAPWPDRWERNRQTWAGRIPASAIAIVHTHPIDSPRLSTGDCQLARSTGLPVFALSRWAIWMIEPDAEGPVAVVSRKSWIADSSQIARK